MKKSDALRVLTFTTIVFIVYLSALPLFHRHGKAFSENTCAVCSLYNETHSKQKPANFVFMFYKTAVSSLVIHRETLPSQENLLKILLRSPPA